MTVERGPAFELLIHELEAKGAEPFTVDIPMLDCKAAAAYA